MNASTWRSIDPIGFRLPPPRLSSATIFPCWHTSAVNRLDSRVRITSFSPAKRSRIKSLLLTTRDGLRRAIASGRFACRCLSTAAGASACRPANRSGFLCSSSCRIRCRQVDMNCRPRSRLSMGLHKKIGSISMSCRTRRPERAKQRASRRSPFLTRTEKPPSCSGKWASRSAPFPRATICPRSTL